MNDQSIRFEVEVAGALAAPLLRLWGCCGGHLLDGVIGEEVEEHVVGGLVAGLLRLRRKAAQFGLREETRNGR